PRRPGSSRPWSRRRRDGRRHRAFRGAARLDAGAVIGQLRVLPRLVATEFGGEERGHIDGAVKPARSVLDRDPCAAGENVFDADGPTPSGMKRPKARTVSAAIHRHVVNLPPDTVTTPDGDGETTWRRDRSAVRASVAVFTNGRSPAYDATTSSSLTGSESQVL